ncbi:response regulator receiver modulated diguanylate cyclase [Candidatus Magnetoovum chiemensis]|nr:response regulator receiver modulated diguanylate cyclase [Candidatus Magnetoovum chiemensis]
MDLNRQKVLIVDDIAINIKVLNEALQDDYSTYFATNGKQAVETASAIMPDIILLDILMPDMNGYEVCACIRKDDTLKDTPIIFITSKDDQEDEASGLNMGAVDYISKPFNPMLVKLRVRNHLSLKKHRDMLNILASTDGLTEIPNRRAFDEYYIKEWNRAVRRKSSLSLLLIDIDYFKRYNDNYGHIQGDYCLKEAAQTLHNCLKRPADLFARYGGEEFVCLLPETDIKGAVFVGNEMRAAIEALKIPHGYSTAANIVTISLGGSEIKPTADVLPKTFLLYVDSLLYKAKQQGRNMLYSEVFSR